MLRRALKSILGFRKKPLEAELLAKEPALMQEYIDICSALLGIERYGIRYEVHNQEYIAFRRAMGAIEIYLDKVKEFTDPEIVIQTLLDGGFAPNDKRCRYNIKDSIRYHTERSHRLILRDEKVGRAQWVNGVEG